MQITMKSSYGVPAGWVAQLKKFGIKTNYRPPFFGGTAHLFKLHGEAVQRLQDPQQAMKLVVNRNGKKVQRHIDAWRPVHEWSEQQVWDIIRRWKVPLAYSDHPFSVT